MNDRRKMSEDVCEDPALARSYIWSHHSAPVFYGLRSEKRRSTEPSSKCSRIPLQAEDCSVAECVSISSSKMPTVSHIKVE